MSRAAVLHRPIRLDDVSVAPPPAAAAAGAIEPPLGLVDRLVAAACELDPNARAEILPADHETPMARRLRERLASSASHPAPRTQEEPAHVRP